MSAASASARPVTGMAGLVADLARPYRGWLGIILIAMLIETIAGLVLWRGTGLILAGARVYIDRLNNHIHLDDGHRRHGLCARSGDRAAELRYL